MCLKDWLALLCAVGLVLNGLQAVETWRRLMPWGINLAVLGAGLAWWGHR